jgi:hypothetical protein
MPQSVPLYDGRTATFDHAIDYTEDPPEGEQRPQHGQIFAYYQVDERLIRVPIGVKQAKFSPEQLPAIIAALLLKL